MVKCMADINLLSVDSGSIFVYILNAFSPQAQEDHRVFIVFPM